MELALIATQEITTNQMILFFVLKYRNRNAKKSEYRKIAKIMMNGIHSKFPINSAIKTTPNVKKHRTKKTMIDTKMFVITKNLLPPNSACRRCFPLFSSNEQIIPVLKRYMLFFFRTANFHFNDFILLL